MNRLSDRFKGGSYLLDNGDAKRYITFYLAAVVFFTVNQIFWWKFFEYYKIKQFVQRSYQDKVFYTMQMAGTFHHVIVASFSAFMLYNSCQNELGLPYPSEKGGSYTTTGKHYGWFHSELCMMELNKGYAYNILISIAYMTVDYITLYNWIEKKTVLNK